MRPKHPAKPRPAKRPVTPASESPAEEATGAEEPTERQRPSPDEVRRPDEGAKRSIEAVAEDGADGGIDATLHEDMRPPHGT